MPQRSTDNVRPEHPRSLQCQLCQCVQMYTGEDGLNDGNLQYFRERFFHDPCTTCPPTGPSLEPLCSFCSHLQLPHIFGCVTPELENLSSLCEMTAFSITWGKGYTELLEDQACPLCALIGSILRNHTTKMDQGDGTKFGDSVSVDFFRMRDESRKLGPWELWIEFSSDCMSSTILGIGGMDVAKDGSGSATYPEPIFGPDVDWELVRQWVWKCHQDHPSQEIPIDTTDKDFKLIDVRNNCLVSASKSWTYAALSYVWGDFRLGKAQAVLANVSQLQQKGGVLLHEPPQCILDAMTVCKNLGINFLWVDRLCIVQDDAQSKHGQIKQMGSIYASAIVTIVAAAGKDAGHGLVGVSRPRLFAQLQQKLLLQGIKFTERLRARQFYESIQQSVWRSRGWTFQEEKLSTALLLFSEHGVSFQCKHLPGRMDIEMEGLTVSDDVLTDPSTLYPSVVSEYSRRNLSFGSDILNAFSGYLGTTFEGQHYFGLPCAYFNQALLWKPGDDSEPRRESNGNETFPSWCWASVTGAIDYHSWFLEGRHKPIASWAVITFPSGRTPQLVAVCEMPSKLLSPRERLRIELSLHDWREVSTWRRYLLKQRLLTPGLRGELSQFWTTLRRQVKSYKWFWFQNKWLSMKHNLFPNIITGLESREVFQAGRLKGYTQIAKISATRLLWPTSLALRRNAPFVLRNKLGKWIGFVDLDRPTAERINAYSLRGKTYSAECLALSLHLDNAQTLPLLLDEDLDTLQDRARKPNEDPKSVEIFKKRSDKFEKEMGLVPSCKDLDPFGNRPQLLTVMMVERTEGVARRVGVGHVYLKRWRESAPSFQTVVLE